MLLGTRVEFSQTMEGGIKTKQDPVEPWAWKLVSPDLQAPWPSNFKQQVQTVGSQGREDAEIREEESEEIINSAQLWERGLGSVSRDTHNNIYELFWRTETPQNGSCYLLDKASFIPERRSQVDNLRTTESCKELPEARFAHPLTLISSAALSPYYKAPHHTCLPSPRLKHIALRARTCLAPLCLPLQWSHSFLYFIQNSVSET